MPRAKQSFHLGDAVKHISSDTVYHIRNMNTKFIIAVDSDGKTKTDYAKNFTKVN